MTVPRFAVPALAAAALLQTLVIGWTVWDRARLISSGHEIRAAVVPVDPRDVFRGDFVVLGYGFSGRNDIALPPGSREGDSVYVLLKRQGPTEWTLSSVSALKPETATQDEIAVKAIVDGVRASRSEGGATVGGLRYGIERFYVPEGEGRAIETLVRDQRVVAVLAVGTDGRMALKSLEADGKAIAQEPPL
ncbi:MAG: GDYXXLXY domain-containing protein [Deltaproteobacteria bacterium]